MQQRQFNPLLDRIKIALENYETTQSVEMLRPFFQPSPHADNKTPLEQLSTQLDSKFMTVLLFRLMRDAHDDLAQQLIRDVGSILLHIWGCAEESPELAGFKI